MAVKLLASIVNLCPRGQKDSLLLIGTVCAYLFWPLPSANSCVDGRRPGLSRDWSITISWNRG
jgi:hypothetical protein